MQKRLPWAPLYLFANFYLEFMCLLSYDCTLHFWQQVSYILNTQFSWKSCSQLYLPGHSRECFMDRTMLSCSFASLSEYSLQDSASGWCAPPCWKQYMKPQAQLIITESSFFTLNFPHFGHSLFEGSLSSKLLRYSPKTSSLDMARTSSIWNTWLHFSPVSSSTKWL